MKNRTLHLVLSAILFIPVLCDAADFSGPVVSILDGDTIEVLHNRHPERIRLSGIDCPEKGQSYGQRASKLGGHYFNGDLVDAGSWRLIDCAYYL